ncbi:MAG: 3-(cis-5,6-dihydroxycyclohexa-1,3-dien-1-yl)propanoate dehydrogenase [Proteobacteria bacterium]|nr:3-(cis-5,6-dihydroxycyclohexa-1,3-dien-1-yl)propanoate dehydrogenase [Pseudomonadota bacterium]
MKRLDEQVVLISGGASGLGAAIVDRFVDEGARVVVLDRSAAGCAEITNRYAGAVKTVTGDVRVYADNVRAVSLATQTFGRLDSVIGNAGIWDYSVSLVDLPEDKLNETFDELFQINVLGYLLLAKAAVTDLVRSQGSIIYTVSNAGFLPAGGGPLYTAAKHAVVGLIRQLAFELAPHVRVNGVAPGAISTNLRGPQSLGMQDRKFPGSAMQAGAADFVPVGRMPTPAEYAGAYVFFACREDNFPATGAILNHDGGFGVRGLGKVLRGGDDLLARLKLDEEQMP